METLLNAKKAMLFDTHESLRSRADLVHAWICGQILTFARAQMCLPYSIEHYISAFRDNPGSLETMLRCYLDITARVKE